MTARGKGRQTGIALLLVVWVLALLTVIAVEFIASGRVKAAAERNKRDDLRGLSLALAGYRGALAALDARITALSVDDEGRLRLHVDGDSEGMPAAAADVPLGGGTYSWRISDADGLVNINDAQRPVLERLLEQCGQGPGADRDTVIDSILDWRDNNRDHRLNGAEEDYYRALDPPYSCKDGPFDVAEELLLVHGVSPELFAGGESDGETRPGLRDLVTTHAGAFNPGTAPEAVLEALGRQRPPKPTAASRHYVIAATGNPGGGAPPRSLRAIVLREDAGDSRSFTLLYWNDGYIPE